LFYMQYLGSYQIWLQDILKINYLSGIL